MTEPSDAVGAAPSEVPVPPLAVGPQPSLATDIIELGHVSAAEALSYQSGLDMVARSQWSYARHRFLRHRLAMVSIVVLVIVFSAGILAGSRIARPYAPDAPTSHRDLAGAEPAPPVRNRPARP